MARDGSGNYNRPVSDYVFNTVISETDMNTEMDQIAAALTASIAKDGQTPTTAVIPFASGIQTDTVAEKTSANGVAVDGVVLKDGRVDWTKGADIASATSTDLSGATGNYLDVTGTTTITGLGTAAAGATRIVQFDGALILTHNATSLILPGGVNITTAAGDVAVFVSEGSGNWRCVHYQPAAIHYGTTINRGGSAIGAFDADGDFILGATAVRSEDLAKQIEVRGASAGITFDDGTARRGVIGIDDGAPTIATGAADNDFVIRALTTRILLTAVTAVDVSVDINDSTIGSLTNSNSTSPYGYVIDFSGASPDNNTNYFLRCEDSTTVRCNIYSDGDLQNHDNSYGAISDLALKQDVSYVGPYAGQDVDAGDGSYCGLFKKYRPAKYRFKTDVAADENAGFQLGLIAQDVKEFAPGLVQGEGTEETPYSLQYSLINMQMLVAMQEIIGRVEALEAA